MMLIDLLTLFFAAGAFVTSEYRVYQNERSFRMMKRVYGIQDKEEV
jgi:hypothetical protein